MLEGRTRVVKLVLAELQIIDFYKEQVGEISLMMKVFQDLEDKDILPTMAYPKHFPTVERERMGPYASTDLEDIRIAVGIGYEDKRVLRKDIKQRLKEYTKSDDFKKIIGNYQIQTSLSL